MGKVIIDLQIQFRRQFFFILLHCMGSANKMYCDNDKFLTLFLFRPLHSLHTHLIRSHALDKPKYGSPIFGKHNLHAASHYTMSCNDPLQYYSLIVIS